jgi:hypothetical protein
MLLMLCMSAHHQIRKACLETDSVGFCNLVRVPKDRRRQVLLGVRMAGCHDPVEFPGGRA